MYNRLHKRLKKRNLTAQFNENGTLISPLPRVKINNRELKDIQYIELALIRFDRDSFIDAMYNQKIVLCLVLE